MNKEYTIYLSVRSFNPQEIQENSNNVDYT